MEHFQLVGAVILEVSGADAPRYLNNRLSNDVKLLKKGHGILAAQLSPQGKCEGLFEVYRLEDDRFLLTCDQSNENSVITAFRRYLVADRVAIRDLSEDYQLWHIVDPTPQIIESFGLQTQNLTMLNFVPYMQGWVAFHARLGTPGYDCILPKELGSSLKSLLATSLALTKESFEFKRISSGNLRFPTELREQFLFSEAGLSSAVSHSKGCYVGQEVVEKIASRGKAPAKLLRLKIVNRQFETGGAITVKGLDGSFSSVGEVLSSGSDLISGESVCFARVREASEVPYFYEASELTLL